MFYVHCVVIYSVQLPVYRIMTFLCFFNDIHTFYFYFFTCHPGATLVTICPRNIKSIWYGLNEEQNEL